MVPNALKNWFVVHFVADILFAIPLLVAPQAFMSLFAWPAVDPISSRLVGAALVGIGVESLLGRNATLQSFETMLRLKVLWSGTAVLGIALSMAQGFEGFALPFLVIFIAFNGLWTYWFLTVRRLLRAG